MLIPSVEEFQAELSKATRLDLPGQRIEMAQRLVNLPESKLAEVHLAEWYANFWKLAGLAPHLPRAPEISQQILDLSGRISSPARRQFFALALIMFGEFKAAQGLIDGTLWTANLREDFEAFNRWRRLSGEPSERVRAILARNERIKEFLREKYSALIDRYSTAEVEDSNRAEKFRIWYCWLQGEANLPPLVRCCYNSLRENAGRYEICFVDEDNFGDYVELPEHILRKFADGKISRTHLSDILRVNLLERYGGLWLDSTILVTAPLIRHKKLLERRYFTQKFYHERRNDIPAIYRTNPSYARWATFAMGSAFKNYPLFAFMKDFYAQYWAEFDEIIDYVLMDFMIDIAYDNIAAVRADMDAVPINNADTNTLVFHLNDSYQKYPYDRILAETFLHKLNWRVKLNTEAPDAVYREIQKRYLVE